jgi:predicted TIM-barrel fold metal-dependent hydrolase
MQNAIGEVAVTKAEDLILISVDDHICEPRDMFEGHVPEKWKDLAPRVVEDENGREQWWYGDLRGRNLGLNAVAGKPREYFNLDAARYDEMRPGCYDVDERVRDMNAGGQLAGLNFPNWTGFAGQVLHSGPDLAVNEIMIKAYNDWHIDEWCAAHPGRFIPCGVLPLFDIELAAQEVYRLASKGCHAVTFSENTEALGLPSIHSGKWDPLFAACAETETVLCCHLGSSSRPMQISKDAPASVIFTLAGCTTANTFGELLWADFWARFPTLKFSLTEGDIGWMPYFVWRAEHVQDRHSGWTKHEFPNGGSPTSVFHDNILCCFINEPIGIELIKHFNTDNVFWESDFPHSDGTWPNAPEALAAVAEDLDDATTAKISHENAMRHYKFDPFRYRTKDQSTAKALRAESPDVDVVTHVGKKASGDEFKNLQNALSGKSRAKTG